MRVEVSRFGKVLLSRPAGREAFLAARAYVVPAGGSEDIELDFQRVEVLTPSWLDEFLTGLEDTFGRDRVRVLPGGNVTVVNSLQAREGARTQ